MEIAAIGKKAGEWAALLAIVGVVGSLWIDREVERRMKELESDPATSPAVVELKTDMQNVKDSQARIERKVDTFSTKFLEYLEREANR